MDKPYQLKYIKYKNKYLNLCKDILTKYKTENYKNQIGGAPPINILFACTSFKADSSRMPTLNLYFDLINETIIKYIPDADKNEKIATSVTLDHSTKINQENSLVKKMIKNNYKLIEPFEMPLIEYINKLVKQPDAYIDVLVLSECDDFVSAFIDNHILSTYKRSFKIEKQDYKEQFESFKDNLFKVYNLLNGYIINIYNNMGKFAYIETSIAGFGYGYIVLHYMCCKLFNKLFNCIEDEEGVYVKIPGITKQQYDIFYDEIYQHTMTEFLKIVYDKTMSTEIKLNKILETFLPIKHFKHDSPSIEWLASIKINQLLEPYEK
jgi:hypothetical protein